MKIDFTNPELNQKRVAKKQKPNSKISRADKVKRLEEILRSLQSYREKELSKDSAQLQKEDSAVFQNMNFFQRAKKK